MAKYRIVRRRSGKTEYVGGDFYWRELKKGQSRDLDWQEIRELNKLPEQKEAPQSETGWPGKFFDGLIAIITLLAVLFFLGGRGLPALKNMPDLSFLARSGQLAKDEALSSLKQAVVTVGGASSLGSGFNLKPDGLIVTNRHVVENNSGVMVTFTDGHRYPARNWYYIGDYDLAIAKIAGRDLPHVELSTELPLPDDPLIFIGNPLGFDWTISEAVMLEMLGYEENSIIRFAGPVRSGSSGSPLFNSAGQVVGVIYASLRDVPDSGLAIPAGLLLSYVEEVDSINN
ncbi:MAG: serine protease [Firmicutes bacterium]|nr:serine protease [Bacillota bacterium]